jgi:hypothetical protein
VSIRGNPLSAATKATDLPELQKAIGNLNVN